MLAGARLGDDAPLAHAPRQQHLPERVVDLVGAGVVQVLALEQHDDAFAHLRRESGRFGDGGGSPDVVLEQPIQLLPEPRVALCLLVDRRELLERGDQGLRDIPPTVRPEATVDRALDRPERAHRLLRLRATPVSARTAAAGSSVRATDVPTSTRSAPAAAIRSTSARTSIPLSATAGTPAGTQASSASATPRSTAKLAKSRLFTPTAVGSVASAWSSSASEWTSTNTPNPWSRAVRARACKRSVARTRTINSTALAPATRASNSCSSSRMKSFRNTGTETACTTRARSSSDPPKYVSSVKTEIATAPPRWYDAAWPPGARSSRMAPAAGDRRFTSAITPTVACPAPAPAPAPAPGPCPASPSPCSARVNERGGGAAAARRSSSPARERRPAIRPRVAERMASRLAPVILAFGAFSGRFASGYLRETACRSLAVSARSWTSFRATSRPRATRRASRRSLDSSAFSPWPLCTSISPTSSAKATSAAPTTRAGP